MFRRNDKESVFCYTFFSVQLIAFITVWILYIYTRNFGRFVLLYSFFSGLALLLTSFLVSFFSKRFSVEKKIIVMLGTTSIFLGIISMSGLVKTNQATLLDIVYKSIQMFVGEFEYSSIYNEPVPLLLNIARFMALFVTFGMIFAIILKQKLYYLNIRLFYRDVLIIAEENSDYVLGLANKLKYEGRKTVLAFLKGDEPKGQTSNSSIPTVLINIDTDIDLSLKICNAKHARKVYLLCKETNTNVLLAKKISLLHNKSRKLTIAKDENRNEAHNLSPDEMLEEYYAINNTLNPAPKKGKTSNPNSVVCYIHYNNDADRRYFSTDEVLTDRHDGFETYFINYYDLAIRQMIARVDIENILTDNPENPHTLINSLECSKIAVAGSGEILHRTLNELAKAFVLTRNYPFEIILLNTEEKADKADISDQCKLNDIININNLSIEQYSKKPHNIDVLFIVSDDEKEIFEILQQVFHFDLHESIKRYAAIAYGNNVEYEILERNIANLIAPYTQGLKRLKSDLNAKIFLGNVKNLITSADAFYDIFAPAIRHVHAAYKSAVADNVLSDFEKLPECFIVSNILSSLHIGLMDRMLGKIKQLVLDENEFVNIAMPVSRYFADTEHERWYNERYLQGYRHSKTQDPLYLKNKNLVHWDKLDDRQKEDNLFYTLFALLTYKAKIANKEDAAIQITEYVMK